MFKKALTKSTLRNQIYDILIDDILHERINLGDKIVNRDLQTRFGVSSTPIRDAINMLYADGILSDVTNSGARLIEFDEAFAVELNAFIGAISALAIDFSSKSSKKDKICSLLEKQIINMEKGNPPEYVEADFRFHKVFFDYSDNSMLEETYKKYNLVRRLLVSNAAKKYSSTDETIRQHREIVKAYANEEYENAMQLMRDHYSYGAQIIKKYSESV